jgi:D-threo-aldose 1-dehydrogenase
VEVTRLGLGTAPLGGWPDPLDEDVARRTVEAAWGLGIRFFDTAPLYGHGFAERRLGEVLTTHPRAEFTIGTKVGRLLHDGPADQPVIFREKALNPIFDFSRRAILRSFEESLERLGLDSVDIAHIHDPDDHHDQAVAEAYPALVELKERGRIRAIGAGMNQAEMLARLGREARFDCLLLAGRYTLLEQGPLDDLLPLCLERGISIFTGGVFNSGVLADPEATPNYNYEAAPREVVDSARRIAGVCRRHDVPLRAAALQFPLGHPAVASVLTGARSPAEIEENVGLLDLPIPDQLWADLKGEGLLREDAPTP